MATLTNTPRPRPRRIVGISLKMYFDLPGTLTYTRSVAALAPLATTLNIDLFIVPDFISLLPAHDILSPTPTLLGAQDTFYEPRGAFTGEISPLNLAQAGVRLVVVGHAERRRMFHESDADVARKAAACVAQGLVPLVCVGEVSAPGAVASAAVGQAIREVAPQVRAVLDAVPEGAEVLIGYEPVWAIGAKEPAAADHVVAVAQHIRGLVGERSGVVRVLYGGSAGPGTFSALSDGVDGLFLGRFGHDIGNLEKVIREMGA